MAERRNWLLFAALLLGCSTDATGTREGAAGGTPPGDASCTAGDSRSCSCDDGGTGTQSCADTWSACDCSSAQDDFGNPPVGVAGAGGSGGTGGTPAPLAGGLDNCDPGFYLGSYNCDLDINGFASPLTGDVSFNLEIDETAIDNECDAEFCPDLVIAESSGVLFGLAGLYGFEAKLEGGLDCTSGEFRATAVDGVWGSPISSDPNDPNALWTVQQPPWGMFDGTLDGTHGGQEPQEIAGEWDLIETAFNAICEGPFSVTLQP